MLKSLHVSQRVHQLERYLTSVIPTVHIRVPNTL